MKRLFTLVLLSTSMLLTGCLDTLDEIMINADGTGTYRQTLDMSKMFDLMEMAAMSDTSAERALKEMDQKSIDSVFKLLPSMDSAASLSAEDRRLLTNATMRMVVNKKQSQFKIASEFPFAKLSDVNRLLALQAEGKTMNAIGKSDAVPGIGQMMGELGGKSDEGGMPGTGKTFDMVVTPNSIQRKINQKGMDELMKGEGMEQMKDMKPMLEAITYRTVITLPRPAKSVTGELAELSSDKKTLTVSGSLADLMSKPKVLEFTVQY